VGGEGAGEEEKEEEKKRTGRMVPNDNYSYVI
jgi:hypothetical protein